MEEKQFLSPHEVADVLGKSQQTILRWLRAGLLKGQKISRTWLISTAEIKRIQRAKKS